MINICFRSLPACLALVLLASIPASADQTPAILSATVDYSGNQVTITGENFSPDGSAPAVAIDSAPLALVSFTNQRAYVSLPAVWSSGSYLLAVTNSHHETGVYHILLTLPLDKLRYHAHDLYAPFLVAGTFGYAGILQELNAPKEWGSGWPAYGRRLASTEGAGVIHTVLAFSLDSTLHQDPRYFHSTHKGFFRRVADVARGTVMTRTDTGGETFSTWRIGSAYGEEFLSNLWYPNRLDTPRYGVIQGSIRVGFDLIANLGSEFWPDIRKKILRRN